MCSRLVDSFVFRAEVGVESVPSSEEVLADRTDVSRGIHMFGLNVVLDIGTLGHESTRRALPLPAAKA